MPTNDRITLRSSTHGIYQCTALSLDIVMTKYAGTDTPGLRAEIQERTGDARAYRDVNTRTECLMILAELNGYATN